MLATLTLWTFVDDGEVDMGQTRTKASVSHKGKVVYSLAPGEEASFGRHSTCDIRLDVVRGHLDKLRSNNSNPPDKDALATMAYERGWVTMETLRRYGLSREATR